MGGAALFGPTVWAQRNAESLVIAVNEGATYKSLGGSPAERFAGIAADLQRLTGRAPRFLMVENYGELALGLKEARYDVAYVHPAHYSIRAMSQSGWHLAALTQGFTEYRASFMVPANSPLKTLADLKGRKVGAPIEDSITSVLTRATLREAFGAELPELSYVRYQDAVPFMVEHGLAACGVSASGQVVKEWQDKGERILHTSKPVPIKHLIVSPKVPAGLRVDLSNYFLGLEQSADGKKRLETLNVPGFIPFEQSALTGIGTWLGV
ncbi:phosphate ABC transporter substrate-binding protein [Verminephrobacter eiseniae]|nr:phosphate ABC transporter substrate-binding protein [Verminephrobacter eiseniae]MCW5296166.1 phosphate ABC transporter substrate-binding protein [Verminephrobacter eiseniae]MCW8185435.1 phosphate ABC transporter substrate-binding protein [Verminephrobacter eiseniae]MCW8224090.1 phosphate ABC transporter substrate-binding protein [Verminephrobacter eiseniae]MCW8235232.1 phosphate ABC transporter substrate-binding protein [Verminephrobacter eiseniae]